MFLLNSRLGLFSAACLQAPLLPKLRGHFAEFLNKGSLVRLRILSSPTCVGLRYGHPYNCQRLFLSAWIHMLRYFNFAPHHGSAYRHAYFTTCQPYRLNRLYHQSAHAILLRQRIAHKGGTGISTSCPSPTTSVLGLGPDLPWADEPSPGNLGLSTGRFLACLSLLIPAFSLLHRPPLLPLRLLPIHYAPLPLVLSHEPEASVVCFSPVTSSAQRHSTSEMLLTL